MKRKLSDEKAYANWILIAAVIGILVIGFFIITASSGEGTDWSSDDTNPITKKRYMDVETTVKVTTDFWGIPDGVKISDVNTNIYEERLNFAWMTFGLWPELEHRLEFKVLSGSEVISEGTKKTTLSVDDPEDTVTIELGPLPDDVSTYTLHIRAFYENSLEDSTTVEVSV